MCELECIALPIDRSFVDATEDTFLDAEGIGSQEDR
jgi:hypothetical protein